MAHRTTYVYGNIWLSSGIAGLFFLYLEILKLHREHLFTGATAAEWATGLPSAFAVYVMAVGLAGTILFAGVRMVAPRGADSPLFARALALCAAGAVWAVVSAYREQTPNVYDIFVATALVLLAFVIGGLPRFGLMTPFSSAAASVTMWLAGIAGVLAAGHYLLLSSDRAYWVTVVSAGWFLFCGIASLILWGFRRGSGLVVLRILFSTVLVIAPLLVLTFSRATESSPGGVSGPNIVLIESDAMRADFGGSGCTMPALDALRDRGTVFTRNRAVASWTLPAVLGQMTSTYPPTAHTDEIWSYRVREQDRTLAEVFAAEGYETCAIVANPVLYGMPGILRGFQKVYTSHHLVLTRRGTFRHAPLLQNVASAWFPSLFEDCFNDSTRNVTDYALAYLRSQKKGKFFLWIFLMDPHAPVDPPTKYRTAEGPWPVFWPYAIQQRWGCPNVDAGETVSENDRPYVRSLYCGEARHVDDTVSAVLAAISPIADSTYVCFTADHGEELWDHGFWGHGHSMYEEVVRTPWLIAGPRIRSQQITEAVSAVDLAPTLAGLTGAPPDTSWIGKDLAPALCDASAVPERPCFARGCMTGPQIDPLEMVVSKGRKLVRNLSNGQIQLFDLSADAQERNDISAQQPDVVRELTQLLDQWDAGTSSTMDECYGTTMAPQERDEAIQRLRSVGYL